ncbi:MAG: GGDEF domain-containing protein [Thermodesulfobacteria bacterium]|nr:GGDEF domain-containing protein [Thermodesulfobacteriota bacterium]
MDIEKCLRRVEEFLRRHDGDGDEVIGLLKDLYQICRKLYDQATIDFLTGLYNRRAFEKQLELAVERARRDRSTFSLILLDLDHFKRVNDLYGHLVGDEVLRKVGSLIRSTMRKVDIPARYGGEEFAIILPGTGFEGALSAAWRLKKRIEETNFGTEERPIHITASMGLGTYRPLENLSARDFLEKVDRFLYAAKNRGRNVIVYESDRTFHEEHLEGLSHEEKKALMEGVRPYDD